MKKHTGEKKFFKFHEKYFLFAINILLTHSNFVYSANDYNVILIVPDVTREGQLVFMEIKQRLPQI